MRTVLEALGLATADAWASGGASVARSPVPPGREVASAGRVANNAGAGANPTIGGIMDTQRPARTQFALPAWPALGLLLVAAFAPITSHATVWIEQVEQSLTCSSFASADTRAQLQAPFIPDVRNARGVQTYFQGRPNDLRQARFRHLTMLAATAWWAELVNDQRLRGDAYLAIQQLAARYAAENPKDLLFRQISRCAQVQVMSVMLEIGEIAVADQLATALVQDYATVEQLYPVEDWPLMLALREALLEPQAQGAINVLTRALWAIASLEPMATQYPLRTSRLMASAARGYLALGQADDARNLAAQSMFITGQPAAAEANWRAFPVLYDVFVDREGPQKAATLISLLGNPTAVPPQLNDRVAAFEALERAVVASEAGATPSSAPRCARWLAASSPTGALRSPSRRPFTATAGSAWPRSAGTSGNSWPARTRPSAPSRRRLI